MYSRILGFVLIVIALVMVIGVAYHNSHKRIEPIVFSDRAMLDGLWHTYKIAYLEPGSNRTLDKERNNVTTSEGESYTMFRAVIWDDKTTFDQSWNWTKNNLQHTQNDKLFSWLYGEEPDNKTYGVLTAQGGANTASDADTDIALSLIFAADRWNDPSYADQAKLIISDIWNNEVAVIKDKPYLLANNVEKTSNKPYYVVDPSYLVPYAYKIFASYDPGHDWKGLADNSYTLLNSVITQKLDKNRSANLPPDWVGIDKVSGTYQNLNSTTLTTNYGYDAMRVPFRLALDYAWYKDPRDKTLLDQMSFLKDQWKQNVLYTVYSHDGLVVTKQEAPAIYGGDVGYFIVSDSNEANSIYSQKLKVLYDPDINAWKQPLSYYDDNWAWFGMALYNNYIINLDQKNAR